MRLTLPIILLWLTSFACHAELIIEISQGTQGAVPIAIPSFNAVGPSASSIPLDVSKVVASDLMTSGRFRPVGTAQAISNHRSIEGSLDEWQRIGVENVVVGSIAPTGNDRYTVSFELWDVYKVPAKSVETRQGELITTTTSEHVITSKRYDNIKGEDLRALAHHISDVVFESLTGIRGAFSTKIAYVLVQNNGGQNQYILEVADMDGVNAQKLVKSHEPLMSPSWSPDGKQIAFVSFEQKKSQIYIMDVATGNRQLLSEFPGINGAPAWSPDGKKLAAVLSKDGSPKIYLIDVQSKKLTQVTRGYSIDTEPTFAPDGRSLFFTSNRGGKPQIYNVDLSTGKTKRVTFKGNYNARPVISPDGNTMVMIHRGQDGVFRIASQNLNNGQLRVLTNAKLDESPSLSPNGAMVLYGTRAYGKGILGVVTIDGRGQLRLPAREGSVQEPAWSPFLS